jgi:hypothetical protein
MPLDILTPVARKVRGAMQRRRCASTVAASALLSSKGVLVRGGAYSKVC